MNPSRQHWMPRTKQMLSGRETNHLRQRMKKFKDLKSKVQTELRKMQDLWWQKKAALFRHVQHKTVLQCHKNRLWPIYIRVLPPVVF